MRHLLCVFIFWNVFIRLSTITLPRGQKLLTNLGKYPMEPAEGLEPPTLTLQISCATIAPCRHIIRECTISYQFIAFVHENLDASHSYRRCYEYLNGAACGNRTRDLSLEGSYVTSTPIPHMATPAGLEPATSSVPQSYKLNRISSAKKSFATF